MENFGLDRDAVLESLAAGILAPSADNRHHLHFRLHDDGFAVHADPAFLECRAQHRRLLTLVSYGAVVENIRLKLTERRRSFAPHWFPDPDDPSLLIRVRGSDLDVVEIPDGLAGQIAARHTNRRFFRGPVLSDADAEAIAGAVRAVPAVSLMWCDEPKSRTAVLRLMRTAETARFAIEPLHRELFESIDFDAGWQRSADEKLAPGSLEVEPPLRGVFRGLRRWPTMRLLNRFGTHRILGFRAGDLPARMAPHLCVLSSRLEPSAAALATGAAFQRAWLAAAHVGIALQPMVAAAILSVREDPDEGLPKPTLDALRNGWHALLGDATPIVVFRMGRAAPPKIRCGRRPLNTYLR